MYKPELYSKHNIKQIRDAKYVLNKFFKSIKWQSKEKVLDIGCGDGKVTREALLPFLPKDFEKLIGIDIATEMVKFAEESTKNDKISFKQFDISSNKIPEDFKLEFHHIFSFYCLNWVLDQRRVFQNIHDMLKCGGEFVVCLAGYHPYYETYERMGKSSKWAPYMKNFEQHISPYYYSDDPGKEMEQLLIQLGFVVHYCKAKTYYYDYPSFSILKETFTAVNSFIKNMSNDEIDDYLTDFCSEVRKLNTVTIITCENSTEKIVRFNYKLMIAYASKSS